MFTREKKNYFKFTFIRNSLLRTIMHTVRLIYIQYFSVTDSHIVTSSQADSNTKQNNRTLPIYQ